MDNEKNININDRIGISKDTVGVPSNKAKAPNKGGLWARTEVVGGYGLNYSDKGKSSLDEVVFSSHNTVPIGGVQYVFERLFGVKGPLTVPTLYTTNGIGKANSGSSTNTYLTPTGDKAEIYRVGNLVTTFGVGITGTAENDITVYPVDYRESGIGMNVVNTDGATIEGTMIPFRYTADDLSETEKLKYFGKKTDADTGYVSYFLKTFDTDPTIKHVYVTGEEAEEDNETEATDLDVWVNRVGDNAIESFTEFILRINSKDVKEWFRYLEQEDRARINTIALFYGEYIEEESDNDMGDYRDCRMFSKLNIPVEFLSLSKDLVLIYRVYGS